LPLRGNSWSRLYSNCFFRASSAFDIFEARLRSLELSLSGQQRLRHIRGKTSVPRTVAFGPAAPSTYSKREFGPSNCRFRASSAFDVFEAGLRSLELLLSKPAAPSKCSKQDFGPLNRLFQASSAFRIFEAGLRVPELFSFGLAVPSGYSIRASVSRVAFSAL
jgi:hypothetical protein